MWGQGEAFEVLFIQLMEFRAVLTTHPAKVGVAGRDLMNAWLLIRLDHGYGGPVSMGSRCTEEELVAALRDLSKYQRDQERPHAG